MFPLSQWNNPRCSSIFQAARPPKEILFIQDNHVDDLGDLPQVPFTLVLVSAGLPYAVLTAPAVVKKHQPERQ